MARSRAAVFRPLSSEAAVATDAPAPTAAPTHPARAGAKIIKTAIDEILRQSTLETICYAQIGAFRILHRLMNRAKHPLYGEATYLGQSKLHRILVRNSDILDTAEENFVQRVQCAAFGGALWNQEPGQFLCELLPPQKQSLCRV
tara:strand:- start:10795 stop:11229 length:435 start_codon:yes stop_codon:yes gene_type:complete